MFKWLFNRCDHEYKKIDTEIRTFPNHESGRYESVMYYILYCPLCDKEKKVNAVRYDRQLEKERLKGRYGRKI